MDYNAIGRRYLKEVKASFLQKSTRQTLIVVAIGLALFGSFRLYKHYINNRQQKASFAFEEAIAVYQRAFEGERSRKEGKGDDWSESELAFQTAYEQNSSSTLTPYFLMYEAQSLLMQNKHKDALKLIDDALGKISDCSPYLYPYKTVQATALIDSGNEKAGVELLKSLAGNANNSFADMAQFFLAQYLLSQDKNSDAVALFKKVASNKDSAWAELAAEYV